MGFEYAITFYKVLFVWIRGNFGVVVVSADVFEAVKYMAEAGGVFGLRIDEDGEDFLLTMVVEAF